ncbi:MAG: hypothetical protein ACJAZB_000653 [Psychrosphaera sp.]|jgi:hypothetical protein|uniref:DUF3545 family protein n=1 Tax=Psychrosphaera sp. F3M07 TaxID=2841560 RepID=UPI001C095796|nr:DUF3545 family protein [Psychrosphaera sp. F3M07]MBU2917286.1 DUF3545 family protein [Psychrosphaera sp. F3M07]
MEGLAEILENTLETKTPSKRTSKRKWREIESIKDKYRLRDELKDIDPMADYDFDNLEF